MFDGLTFWRAKRKMEQQKLAVDDRIAKLVENVALQNRARRIALERQLAAEESGYLELGGNRGRGHDDY